MALDWKDLERTLCERMCATVRLHERGDGVFMLDTPFRFPDGDHYPIYLDQTPQGRVILSDRGHTLMHMSYEHDVDLFYEGTRAALREQIVKESEIREDGGVFSKETHPDLIVEALIDFGQALTRIYDLSLLGRERTPSGFYGDLKALLLAIVDEQSFETDYVLPDVPDGKTIPWIFASKAGKDRRFCCLAFPIETRLD